MLKIDMSLWLADVVSRKSAANLSVRQLADQVGINFMTLQRTLSGARPVLACEFMSLSAFFGLDVYDYLLEPGAAAADSWDQATYDAFMSVGH